MLSMENVSYSYKKRKETHYILKDVTISFCPGKVYSIFGSSGVGKTTCLSLLGGLEKPSSGVISMDEIDIRKIGYSNLRKHSVSYVFQDYHLFSYMTAIENVELAASISDPGNKSQKAKAVQLLTDLGIDEETMSRQVSQTSGGQQQRGALARALISNPTYILADEPTGNLDHTNSEHIVDLLTSLAHQQNKCIIVATHSEYVRDSADVHIEMKDGQLCIGGNL